MSEQISKEIRESFAKGLVSKQNELVMRAICTAMGVESVELEHVTHRLQSRISPDGSGFLFLDGKKILWLGVPSQRFEGDNIIGQVPFEILV